MSLEEHWDDEEEFEDAPGSQVLRPYQRDCVEAVMGAIDSGLTRVMYTQATGCGKTTTFSEIIKRLVEDDHRVLVLAHRTELINQAYKRIKDHCGFGGWEIGKEIAQEHATSICRVVVGSVQTCYGGKRPAPPWTPTVIICDEVHHSVAATYRKIATRFGVDDGSCIYIGCTATPKRTDKFSLFAERPDGSKVILERKGKPPREATYEDSIFQRLVYEYTPLNAMDDGWLVEPKVYTVNTGTSLDDVETNAFGDFVQEKLEKTVNTGARTSEVITAWARDTPERPTIVFCAGVEHAHDSAALWRQCCRGCHHPEDECDCESFEGFNFQAIDGTTEPFVRAQILKDFTAGKVNGICNFGILTEGTDLPNCSCIVNLRPTKSWTLFVQMQGRGLRPLPGLLDAIQGDHQVEHRLNAIAESDKSHCAIIDVVDLYKKIGDICTAPAILDLPVKLDMQGHGLLEAKKMLDNFKEIKNKVIGECPGTYEELEAKLEQVSAMVRSGARSAETWKATDDGYRFAKTPPKYQADLLPDGDAFRLKVKYGDQVLLDRSGKAGHDFKAYLDKAQERIERVVAEHQAIIPKGTLGRLSDKQVNVLLRNRHTREQVDQMTYGYAKVLIGKYLSQYQMRRAG